MVLLNGCESKAQRAQALIEQGKYQQVIDKYPDTQFARRAAALYAEQLLDEGKYDVILKEYPQTPAAYQARQAGAQVLFDEGKYEQVLEEFPNSAVATDAANILADSLYAAEELDLLIERFPDSPKAKLVKEDRAKIEFDKAMKLSGKDQEEALNSIVRTYRGTTVYKEALSKLRDVRNSQRKR
jgi:hypothetical protein